MTPVVVQRDMSFANNLPLSNAPTISSGQFSNAFTQGTGIYMTNVFTTDPNDTGLPIYGAESYTVAVWVKGAGQVNRSLYTEGNSTNANPIFILRSGNATAANSNKLDVILRNARGQTLINHRVTSTVVLDDVWHQIAWVDDRGAVSIYVDGVLDPSSADFHYVWSLGELTMDTVIVGTLLRTSLSAISVNFNGQIDEVATWERALSAEEVDEVRTNGV